MVDEKENPPVKWKAYQRPNCRKHEDEKEEQTRPDRRKARTKIRPYIVNLTREDKRRRRGRKKDEAKTENSEGAKEDSAVCEKTRKIRGNRRRR